MGGVRAAAEILNFMFDRKDRWWPTSRTRHRYGAAHLDEMFVFENMIDIEDRGIQLILRRDRYHGADHRAEGSPAGLREKFFKNMSNRAAEMMREDLEAQGRCVCRRSEEQKKILQVARRLAEEGQIILGGLGKVSIV